MRYRTIILQPTRRSSVVTVVSPEDQLLKAAMDGSKSKILHLLKRVRRDCRATDGGTTPLHNAAFAGHLEAIEILTDKKLDTPDLTTPYIDTSDNDGWSPLHCTLVTDNTDALRLLLKLGANPVHLDKQGNNPLFRAMLSKITATGLTFLELVPAHREALLNHQNLTGQTPLHVAAEGDSTRWVSALLNLNVNTELRDRDGRTPLLAAANKKCDAIVELLLNKPVAIDAADTNLDNVLHIAVTNSSITILRNVLARSSAKTIMNNRNARDMTPLMLAVSLGSIVCVKLLLDAQASLLGAIELAEKLIQPLKEGENMFAALQTCLRLLRPAQPVPSVPDNKANGQAIVKKKKHKKKKPKPVVQTTQLVDAQESASDEDVSPQSEPPMDAASSEEVAVEERGEVAADVQPELECIVLKPDDLLCDRLSKIISSGENIVTKCQQEFYLHRLIKQIFQCHSDPVLSLALLNKVFALLKKLESAIYQQLLCLTGEDGASIIQQVVVSSFARQNVAAVKFIATEVKAVLSKTDYKDLLFKLNHKNKGIIFMASSWENKACLEFFGREIAEIILSTQANHANRLMVLEKIILLSSQLQMSKKLDQDDQHAFVNRLSSIVGIEDLSTFIRQLEDAAIHHDLKLFLITLAPPVSTTPHYGWGCIHLLDMMVTNNNHYFLALFLQTIDTPDCYPDVKKNALGTMKTSQHEAVIALYREYQALWTTAKAQHSGRNGFFVEDGQSKGPPTGKETRNGLVEQPNKAQRTPADIRPC